MLGAGVLAVVLWVVIGAAVAHAQTVDMRPTGLAVLDWLANAAVIVGGVLAGFAVRFFNSKTALLNAQEEAELVERLRTIIGRGINFAKTVAQSEVAKDGSGLSAIRVDNWFIKVAADYAQEAAPGILRRFYPDPEKMRRKLEDMVIASIPEHFPVGVVIEERAVGGGLTTPPIAARATAEVGKPAGVPVHPFTDAPVSVG